MISVEAHSMINSEHPAGAAEDVAALAIGIVDQYVEDREQPQIGNVGVDHRRPGDRSPSKTFYRGKTSLAWAASSLEQDQRACWSATSSTSTQT